MKNYELNSAAGIKYWAEEDRPREKLLLRGKRSLTNAELLAIIIGSGTRNQTAVDVCRTILRKVNNRLAALSQLSVADLVENDGIGEAKAISIIAALELGSRRSVETAEERPVINNSKVLYELIGPVLNELTHEEFWAFYTNTGNKLLGKHEISVGGVSGTVVDARIVFKKAIEFKASGIFLVHNHPSGNAVPSESDVKLTRKLAGGAKLLDMSIVDHLIIAGDKYYSFADNRMI